MDIDKESTYRLKVDVQGNSIKIYVDDKLKVTATTDASFSDGEIGLRSYKAEAKFDNILVTVK